MTLTEAQQAAEGFRDRWNRNIDRCREGALTGAAFHAAQQKVDRDRDALRARLLDDPASASFVCNKTVTFQGTEGNHEVGDLLEARFPLGVDDSESGQGSSTSTSRWCRLFWSSWCCG